MNSVKKYLRYLLLISLSIVSACATNSRLSYVSPDSIDLSGDWVLDESLSQTVVMVPPKRSKSEKGPPKNAGKGERPSRTSAPRRDEDENAERNVPSRPTLMTATEIKIDQGDDGMGISYPQNPYVDVDWGETKARRGVVTAGWTPQKLLVIRHNNDKQAFTETYRLNSSATILNLTFTVNSIDGKRDFVRVFKRRNAD